MFFTYLYVYFVSPLLWPWCIYASHNARTGRPCEVALYKCSIYYIQYLWTYRSTRGQVGFKTKDLLHSRNHWSISGVWPRY